MFRMGNGNKRKVAVMEGNLAALDKEITRSDIRKDLLNRMDLKYCMNEQVNWLKDMKS